jgi:prolipoprotein diacylglyceryltransferase
MVHTSKVSKQVFHPYVIQIAFYAILHWYGVLILTGDLCCVAAVVVVPDFKSAIGTDSQ